MEQPLVEPLSERELEVLHLVARGDSNQEIAKVLVIALDTVKRHVTHIFEKLGVNNRVQAVARARALGLLSDEFISGHHQALPKNCFLLLFFLLIEISIGCSMSVVIPREWDSLECEVLHIYPTKV